MTISIGQTLRFENGEAIVLDVVDGKVFFTYTNLKSGSSCDPNKVYQCDVDLLSDVPRVQ